MDASGKPILSRKLLQLLANTRSMADVPIGTPASSARQDFTNRQRGARRGRIGIYERSHLGNSQSSAGADSSMRRSCLMRAADNDGQAVEASNNINVPAHKKHINSGVNRPSAGFQEPPSRRFDPFR